MNGAGVLAAVIASAAMGASATLHAQARGTVSRALSSNETSAETPPLVLDEAARATKIAEMEVWLGRLVGSFRVKSTWHWRDSHNKKDQVRTYDGSVACRGIGEGAGVRCTFHVMLPPPDYTPLQQGNIPIHLPILDSTLPSLYFGINPDTPEIQVVVVQVEGVGVRSGTLAGNEVRFSVDNWKICQEFRYTTCWMVGGITAEPSGEIFMRMAVDRGAANNPLFLTKNGHLIDIEVHLSHEPSGERDVHRREWSTESR